MDTALTKPTKEQINLILEKIGFEPTKEQTSILYCPSRVVLVAGGERAGKSAVASAFLMTRLVYGKLYWLVAADYGRTYQEFVYIQEHLDKLGIAFDATKNVDPGEILIQGGFRIVTKSANDPRKLAMEAPDGILGCEGSQLDYETFLRLRGRIAEKRGWLLLSGTFESSLGWYPEAYLQGQIPTDEFTSFSMPTWTNTAIFPGGRQDHEILALERIYSKEWFAERFGGVPAPPRGLVFNEFRNHIHTGMSKEFEFNPAEEVYIFVDPGYATAYTVLAVQKRGEHLYVFDEVYERGLVTSDIIKVCKQRPWWNKIIGGVIDIAALQHQAQVPVAEIWQREAGIPLRSKKISIRDGVEAVKRFLLVNPITNQPLIHINIRCKGLISEMGGCPNPITQQTAVYAWREDREGNIIGDTPNDQHNHSCKALSYGIVDLFGYSSAPLRKIRVRFF